MSPLVSIYIPTHNRPDFLRRALTSLVGQTYKNFQVLVCDDGSSVDLSEVRREFEGKFISFKWFRNEKPMGACASRNKLIENADGAYITGLDDDDEFHPYRLQTFLEFRDLDKYSFLCSRHVVVSRAARYQGGGRSGVVSLDALLFRNIVGNQVFIRTEYLRSCGGFDPDMPAWQDYDTWVRVVKKYGDAFKIKDATYFLNVAHEQNRITNSPKAHLGYLRFVDKHSFLLTEEHRRSLCVSDKINRGVALGLMDSIYCLHPLRLPLLFKSNLKRILGHF